MEKKRLHRSDEDDNKSDDLSPLPAVEKVEDVRYMLHRKCAVIKLVRKQILNLDESVSRELEEIKKCKSVLARLLRNKLLLLLLLLLPFMAWFLLVCGAKTGAQLCCSCSILINWFASNQGRDFLF